jgi:hypothetical protein
MIGRPVFRCSVLVEDGRRLYFTDGPEPTLDPDAATAKTMEEWNAYGLIGDMIAQGDGKPPVWELTARTRVFEPVEPTSPA